MVFGHYKIVFVCLGVMVFESGNSRAYYRKNWVSGDFKHEFTKTGARLSLVK